MTKSWHYPRTNIAQSYLTQLKEGGHSIAIFAERRKGKTQFLLEDITPLAEKSGISVAYIDFWEQRNNPSACIARGIRRAIENTSPSKPFGWKKEVKMKLPLLEAKVSKDTVPMPEIIWQSQKIMKMSYSHCALF
jgi:transcriptional regulator with XRE-family HTH domain